MCSYLIYNEYIITWYKQGRHKGVYSEEGVETSKQIFWVNSGKNESNCRAKTNDPSPNCYWKNIYHVLLANSEHIFGNGYDSRT